DIYSNSFSAFPDAFQIQTPRKSFSLIASSQEDKKKWITHIAKFVSEAKESKGHLPPTEHAAVWVQDKKTNRCMHCFNYEFSVVKRRHCRKCGIVVCGPCSNHKILMENISKNPLRVCDSCYEKSRKDINKSTRSSSNPAYGDAYNLFSKEEEYQTKW
ncbi:hypothetical protein MXB_3311, partial [Myxobolus squamalis]